MRCGTALSAGTLRFPAPRPGNGPAPAVPAAPAVVPTVSGPRRRSTVPIAVVGAATLLVVVFGFLHVWLAVVALMAVAFLVAYVWWEAFVEGLAVPGQRFAKRLVDNLFSFFRMLRVSTTSWTRKGRAEVRVRSRQLQVRRQHERALRALGHAVYRGDQREEATARARAAETEEELRRCAEELSRVHAVADARVAREMAATDSTREFR